MKRFFSLWVFGGLALFYFGPIPWSGARSPEVALFVLGCLGAFLLGSQSKGRRAAAVTRSSWIPQSRTNALIIMGVHAALTLFYIYLSTGLNALNSGSYSSNFGAVYQSYEDFSQHLRLGLIGQLVSFAKAGIFPVVLAIFVERFRDRVVVGMFIAPLLVSSFLRGTDKEVVDVFVLCAFAAALHGLLKWSRVLVGTVLAAGGIALFFLRKVSRFDGSLPACLPTTDSCFNYGGWFAQSFGQSAEVTRIFLVHYVTNGYQGLSMAFSLPWHPNWGLGHLPPIKAMACHFAQFDCTTADYQHTLTANGWDSSAHWTSVYPVLANDFSFYLVPVFMVFVGVVFRRSIDMWRATKDPAAGASVLVVAMFIVYSSVNMQVAISLDWAFATLVFLYITPWRRIRTVGPSEKLGDRVDMTKPQLAGATT